MFHILVDCIRFVFVDVFGHFWGCVFGILFTFAVLGFSFFGLFKLIRLLLVKVCSADE